MVVGALSSVASPPYMQLAWVEKRQEEEGQLAEATKPRLLMNSTLMTKIDYPQLEALERDLFGSL